MIYLFDKDEKLIKIVRKSAVKTALQKYALTTERYVSDRLTVELKGLNADELEQVEYMAIQTMEDAHTFHYFYVAQKFSDELTTLIGVQSGIEELRKSPVYDKRPQNALARDVITDLLAGTNWQARFVGETTAHSTNFYYTSVFDALKKVCEVWDLEMQFFVEMNGNRIGGRYIDFKQRIGEAVGKRVVYGHNALQILQEVERTNIFTALIGRGKGEETSEGYGRKITFENVVWSRTQGKPVDKPKGQKYLELPLMTRQYGIKNTDGTMRPKIGFVDFSEEDNPEILIERTYKALVDSARPQLTLKTSSVYLKGVKVGDTIRVVRHDKKLDYDTRIFEITFNRLNNQSSDIKLGDRIGESNEAKAQTIADKAVEQFVNNEFSNFVQNLPDYLPSADGFNNNWYGAEDPTVKYPGKVLINDIWYKPDPEHEGHKIMLRWTGEVWEEILRTYESEALRDRIAEEIAQVNQSMQTQSEEHDRQVADILSKTQSVEELANQAKTDAASAIARANQVKTEAIADAQAQVATVSQALNTAKTDLQNQVNWIDAKAVKVQSDANALRTDLNLQASKILEQAQAQTALTSRVTTVETLADGTRSTVAELSKTVSKATSDITSVTSRTKTVEDTLSQTRTQYDALSQTVNAQTGQIDSINRKTADLQSGINGVTEQFENLRVGQKNLILNSDKLPFKQNGTNTTIVAEEDYFVLTSTGYTANSWGGVTWDLSINSIKAGEEFSLLLPVYLDSSVANDAGLSLVIKNHTLNLATFMQTISGQTDKWFNLAVTFKATRDLVLGSKPLYLYFTKNGKMRFKKPILVSGNVIPSDWSPADEDTAQQIAEYKRTADQNYAGLQSTVSTLDGKVTQNKSEQVQTADAIKSRLNSLETYKDGESTRAQSYFEASKTETAKQITAERTAIASNYVAKSIYDEDARGTTLKLNEIKTTADTAKQNLATYQETVDRKLTELTSSTQTLDGKINTASAKVDTVAGQIRTEISEVEGKIPTTVGGQNLIKNGGFPTNTQYWSSWNELMIVSQHNFYYNGQRKLFSLKNAGSTEILASTNRFEVKRNTDYTLSFYAFAGSNVIDSDVYFLGRKSNETNDFTSVNAIIFNRRFSCSKAEYVTVTFNSGNNDNGYIRFDNNGSTDGQTAAMFFGEVMLVEGTVARTYEPSPEEVMEEVKSVKTTITQTASGVEQLSTSLATTDGKVTTAETKINQLISDVSSKVSQTEYNTLTGRVSNAESAITQNATEISKRLTSTQVDKAITDKGYATVTVLNNKVKETADSFSRTISETKALIPTNASSRNLATGSSNSWNDFVAITANNNWVKSLTKIAYGGETGIYANSKVNLFVYISADDIVLNSSVTPTIKLQGPAYKMSDGSEAWGTTYNPFHLAWQVPLKSGNNYHVIKLSKIITADMYANFKGLEFQIRIDGASSGKFHWRALMVTTGEAFPDCWSPPFEDLATVTALHNVSDTVDSHTRTIGAVGTTGSILDNVSKVTQTANGLVTEVSGTNGLKTQVSTLAGSYAIKNLTNSGTVLNQLNLNKDGSVRIDGKLVQITGTTYIQDGVISSAKIANLDAGKVTTGTLNSARIATNSITGSHILFDQAFFNGFTANEAYLQQLFAKNAFITQVQAVALSASNVTTGVLRATNGALDIDLDNANVTFNQSATINFNSDSNALVRKKGDVTAFVNFADDPVSGGVYVGIGVTSHAVGVTTANNSDRGKFAGMRVYRPNDSLDLVRLIGDTLELRHGTEGNYFYFTPSQLRNNVDMLKLAGAVYTLSRIFMHLSANGWDFNHPSFIAGVKDEMARGWLHDFAIGGLPR